MKKFQAVFLFMFLIACSPSQPVLPTVSYDIETTSTPPATLPTLTPIPTTMPAATLTPIGGGSGKITFTSERDGEQGIYVINTDGSNLVELAGDIPSKFYPAWTLDGAKVSFSTATEKSASLYIIDADGSNLVKVLDTSEIRAYDQISPDSTVGISCCTVWSPDGEKIIFKTSRDVGRFGSIGHIHILNLTNNQKFDFRAAGWAGIFWSSDSSKFGVIGTDRCGGFWLCVMNTADGIPVDLKGIYSVTFPSNLYWSPDGKKITFAAFWNSKNMDVFVLDEDFSNAINITSTLVNGQNEGPVWSPDSQKIAFTSCDVNLCELYVANADGTNSIKLTPQILGLNSMVWSRDSEKVVYVSVENGNSEIFIADSDGSKSINLTKHPADDSNPVWSPDGTKLAFVSDRDGNDEIYIMNVNDQYVFRLTKNDTNDFSPIWLP
ncbi:MAG: PD40 domain-containing protein [Chloroflexi bacterium]|nr:PD40 domain-containing protein [Chloroflexota bacterium]